MSRLLAVLLGMALVLSVSACAKPKADGVSAEKGKARSEASSTTAESSEQSAGGRPTEEGASTQPSPKTARKGQRLREMTTPPPHTGALLPLPKKFGGARFRAVVEPYGLAPKAKGSPQQKVLVKIIELEPLDGDAKKFEDMDGRNAVITFDRRITEAGAFERGGRYRVVLSVRPSRGLGVLYVEDVEPLE